MANPNRPNENANKTKAEGERWSSEENSVRKAEHDTPPEDYPVDEGDNAGGITNRPLDEEVDNQEALPPRGMSRDDRAPRDSDDIEMEREARRSER